MVKLPLSRAIYRTSRHVNKDAFSRRAGELIGDVNDDVGDDDGRLERSGVDILAGVDDDCDDRDGDGINRRIDVTFVSFLLLLQTADTHRLTFDSFNGDNMVTLVRVGDGDGDGAIAADGFIIVLI
jgi:hypothetical protein